MQDMHERETDIHCIIIVSSKIEGKFHSLIYFNKRALVFVNETQTASKLDECKDS